MQNCRSNVLVAAESGRMECKQSAEKQASTKEASTSRAATKADIAKQRQKAGSMPATKMMHAEPQGKIGIANNTCSSTNSGGISSLGTQHASLF